MFDIKTKLLLRKINKQLAIFILSVFIKLITILCILDLKDFLYQTFKSRIYRMVINLIKTESINNV